MITCGLANPASAADGSKFARSDSDSRFLHHIDLYDANNRKITPDSDQPYSSVKTCGRCHDYETISHGWHFNAFSPKLADDSKKSDDSTESADRTVADGREGEPWIWTDARTGTQLPLSYRDWDHSFQPDALGITPWQMTEKFGGRIPGGGVAAASENGTEDDGQRWQYSGNLEIDCMICHAASGAYDFNQRRDQIDQQNFSWAATAGLRLGTIKGKVSSIKDGSDPADDAIKAKMPKVTYDGRRFGADGTVFMDLIREPVSNACYQCHSNRIVGESGVESRWVHDEDVHLQSGMVCADCHRNGIDHHIVRGFDGEQNPSGKNVATLSCAGCHLGDDDDDDETTPASLIARRAGRLGSPKPLHVGLPPLHFEKLSCTACHGGPAPREAALRLMTSLSHGLGDKGHRDGSELPAIQAPVYVPGADGKVGPKRAMWPAYWGTVKDGQITPIHPETVYDNTRRALRVRKDFVAELVKPKLSSSDLKKILGEERYKTPRDEWTDQEREKADETQANLGREAFAEKVSAAIEALEKELKAEQVVYVSAGMVYGRGDEEKTIKLIELQDSRSVDMVSWPMAHNVRSAGWSLGIAGCTECHSEEAKIFASTVTAMGPGPDDGDPVSMATLQGVDANQRLAWNELFQGRKSFKYIVGGSIAILLMSIFVGIGAIASRVAGRNALNDLADEAGDYR